MRFRPPRPSLLVAYCALSLVLTVVLGGSLAWLLDTTVKHRARDAAERSATLVADAGIGAVVTPADLAGPDAGRLEELDSLLASARLRRSGVQEVKLFNAKGKLVFSSGDDPPGASAAGDAGFQYAIAGTVASRLHGGRAEEGEDLLEVYVPLRFGDSDPVGVYELYFDYSTIRADARADALWLTVLVAAGLLVLWGALLWLVGSASRRLRRQAAEQRHHSLHDDLTGLPNRVLLQQAAEAALAAGDEAAVLLLDLDRFKDVNDALGHDHGDLLLRAAAERIRAVVREQDLLARLGGDEFAVFIRGEGARRAATELALRLPAALDRPVTLGEFIVTCEASIGVARFPDHAATATELLQRADVAMYQAKHDRTGVRVYDPQADRHSAERLELLAELKAAIDGGQLRLHYQPLVRLSDGRAIGAEALVRWEHPERGLLPPVAFLPAAERTGLVAPLTRWVLDTAVAQSRAWLDRGLELPIAVNLAGPNVLDLSLPAAVAEVLTRHSLPPRMLCLEVSENTVMVDLKRALAVLGELQALGVRLSLDDFGTGQTSLGHLTRLPIDELKVDRSFVAAMATDEGTHATVRAMVELAGNLGMDVVAEGIEDESTVGELVALGCAHGQGFLYSRPVPAGQLPGRLSELALAATRA